jgi:Predicted AAA-ATPase
MMLIKPGALRSFRGAVVMVVLLKQIKDHQKSTKRRFYCPLKNRSAGIAAGVSRFSKVSLFSGLNSLTDLSLREDYADLLGLTEKEITANFGEYLDALGGDRAETIAEMRPCYNGYRFARDPDSATVYNPWSALNYLETGKLDNYWFASATPTFAIELIRREGFPVGEFERGITGGTEIESNFDSSTLGVVSVLFQTGYLTIESYDRKTKRYRLVPPNEEVRESLLKDLFFEFVGTKDWVNPSSGLGPSEVQKMSFMPSEAMETWQRAFVSRMICQMSWWRARSWSSEAPGSWWVTIQS